MNLSKKTYDINKSWSLDEIKYQKYIDNFVKKQTKPLIFVGLNDNPLGKKNIYYNVHSQHNFYIDIDDMSIVKQKCIRLLTNEIPNDKMAMNDLINNNDKFVKGIKFAIDQNCNIKNVMNGIKKWNNDYKKQGYLFLSREQIYKKVSNILNKIIN